MKDLAPFWKLRTSRFAWTYAIFSFIVPFRNNSPQIKPLAFQEFQTNKTLYNFNYHLYKNPTILPKTVGIGEGMNAGPDSAEILFNGMTLQIKKLVNVSMSHLCKRVGFHMIYSDSWFIQEFSEWAIESLVHSIHSKLI